MFCGYFSSFRQLFNYPVLLLLMMMIEYEIVIFKLSLPINFHIFIPVPYTHLLRACVCHWIVYTWELSSHTALHTHFLLSVRLFLYVYAATATFLSKKHTTNGYKYNMRNILQSMCVYFQCVRRDDVALHPKNIFLLFIAKTSSVMWKFVFCKNISIECVCGVCVWFCFDQPKLDSMNISFIHVTMMAKFINFIIRIITMYFHPRQIQATHFFKKPNMTFPFCRPPSIFSLTFFVLYHRKF
jgi:hypothetical protein